METECIYKKGHVCHVYLFMWGCFIQILEGKVSQCHLIIYWFRHIEDGRTMIRHDKAVLIACCCPIDVV